jgi:hypothetical protein
LSAASTGDILPAQIAFAPSGEAAVAFGRFNPDFPERSRALLVTRSPVGKVSRPRAVPNAQEVLALAYDGSALELLRGASTTGFFCCNTAGALRFVKGAFRHPRTLVSDVNGAALGGLVALPGSKMLAAIASGAGVWVAPSPGSGRFPFTRRLTSSSASPQTLAVAGLPHGRTAVAWTQTPASQANVPASTIYIATGTAKRAPRARRLAAAAPAGHAIDELALAGGTAGPTGAWIESWTDRAGAYHAQTVVADLGGLHAHQRTFSTPAQLASGIALAADAKGDQVLVWKTCDELGLCSVRAASRAAGKRFGTPQRLGQTDPGEVPAAAVAPNGDALVGWAMGNRVLAATRHGARGRFGAPRTLAASGSVSNVAVALGPTGQALVAWTQGVAAPRLFAAFHP